MIVTVAGEGPSDIAAATRLVEHTGHTVYRSFPLGGKSQLDRQLPGYNNAAKGAPWLVLRDLDHDEPCAPNLIRVLLPNPSELMLFRVAVRSLESWLLADNASFAAFFGVRPGSIPHQPDVLRDPKQIVLALIAAESRPSISKLMLPGVKTRKVGPAYTNMLIEFISAHWNIDSAAARSPSLARCLAALGVLTG